MKFQIFPQKGEWKELYHHLSLWLIPAGGCIGLFWLWHFDYTGAFAVGSHDTPRLLDVLAFPVWVALLVLAAHFAQYVHTRPLFGMDYSPDRIWIDYITRRGMVYILLASTAVVGIEGVWWEGTDVTTATLGSALMLWAALMVYGIMTTTLLFLRWSHRWLDKMFPKQS